jgi:antitoxin component YwqK of YwqJK toxin-antitoxin module
MPDSPSNRPSFDAPLPWWESGCSICPSGCILDGAPPPEGHEVWCRRWDGLRQGPSTRWTVVGRTDTYYVDGVRQGWELEWTPGGRLRSACEYLDGVRHGKAEHHYEKGSEEGSYVAGKRHGAWITRRVGGAPAWQAEYDRGTLHGRWTSWHMNGQIACTGSFAQGKRVQEWTWWHDNGNIAREGTFLEGVPDGLHRSLAADGNVLDESVFAGGTGHWIEFHESGAKKLEGAYLDGKRHGRWTRWDKNGGELGSFDLTRGTGAELDWHSAGQPSVQVSYCNDVKDGKEITWDERGNIVSIEEYDAGSLIRSSDYEDGQPSLITEWADGEITGQSNVENGVVELVSRYDPPRERRFVFESGQIRRSELLLGSLGQELIMQATGAGATIFPVESHCFQNTSITFETVEDRIAVVVLQVGETSGAHQRLRFKRRTQPGAPHSTGPREDLEDEVPKPSFSLAAIEYRTRHGKHVLVELTDLKISRVSEYQGNNLTRTVALDEPQYVDIQDVNTLIERIEQMKRS